MDRRNLIEILEKELNKKTLSNLTKRCYKNSFKRFIGSINQKEDIKKGLLKIKNKKELSHVVNAIRLIQKNNILFNLVNEKELKEIIKNKSPNRIKSYEPYKLQDALNSINGLREDKYRLAYRLMIASGLRVSEISALRKEDIEITDRGIKVIVQNGKGGKYGEVECLEDKYLMKKLKPYLESVKDSEKIFYSEGVMQKKAQKLGFKCHDLRRAYSKLVKKEVLKSLDKAPEDKRKEIIEEEVMKALRHSKFETSKTYLYSKRIKV